MKTQLILAALSLGACMSADETGKLVPATVDEDPSLPQIEIAGAKLHAEAFGDPSAPLIITLHGGPGSDYRSILPLQHLSDRYRVVFWDQRGAGLSQRFDANTYTMPGYLEDLRLVIEHYTTRPDQPVVFIAHSWGAMYATWFINEYGTYGGRVKGAILSEPGAFNTSQLEDFIDGIQAEISFTAEQLNDATWSRQFMSASDHERADYLHALLSYKGLPSEQHDPNKPTPFWRRGAAISSHLPELALDQGFDWTTNLSAFTTKVLFLRGEKNTVATLAHQQKLAAFYPSSEVITIPGTGHEMVWEKPDEYLAYTNDYLRQIGF